MRSNRSDSKFAKYRLLILVSHETSNTTRKATGVTIQHHQILWLPQKKPLMIDLRHILNNSEHTAPASKSHSAMCDTNHVKRHLACVEQQDSPSNVTSHEKWLSCSHRKRQQCEEQQHSSSNITKYCTCHKKVTLRHHQSHEKRQYDVGHTLYGTSFTMRGATVPTLKRHQICPSHENDSHDWSSSHRKCQHCAEQQHPPSNVSCTCYKKMTLRHHQSHDKRQYDVWHIETHLQCVEQRDSPSNVAKCAPARKMSLMIDPSHIGNVNNAWSNSTHPPTSPNTAPVTEHSTPKPKRNS